ncbi:protein of unknown function [Maridesulfovibrio hydrothermalis AM13 = DSM 14728]|uniref:Uncharacterized protein n=1 Tax=Maridesulfovibrio hydrothermalis AM13 = DSM 14728 TaxID=1121451 RepID=L0RFW3_9BACT|nr:protein of unknown function [Maridesulfovibrio hydrothermalis AM13 = DSM 14728]
MWVKAVSSFTSKPLLTISFETALSTRLKTLLLRGIVSVSESSPTIIRRGRSDACTSGGITNKLSKATNSKIVFLMSYSLKKIIILKMSSPSPRVVVLDIRSLT